MKLNIGSGSVKKDGFISVDIRDIPEVDVVDDCVKLEKFEDNSVDEIYTKDVVESFPWDQWEFALMNWNRVLKIGGKLEIITVDFGLILNQMRDGRMVRTEILKTLYDIPSVSGEQARKNVLTMEWLLNDLGRAGFSIIYNSSGIEPGTSPRCRVRATKKTDYKEISDWWWNCGLDFGRVGAGTALLIYLGYFLNPLRR